MYFAIARQPLGHVAAPSSSHFFALAALRSVPQAGSQFLRARCAPLSPASGFPVSSRSLRSAQSRKRVPSLGLRPSFMVIDSHLPSASFIVTHRNYLVTTNDSEA